MSNYVVFDSSAIFGLGETPEDAWGDCAEWANDAFHHATQEMGDEAPAADEWLKNNFRCTPATDALVEQIKGGKVDVFGTLPDGRACTMAELEAATA